MTYPHLSQAALGPTPAQLKLKHLWFPSGRHAFYWNAFLFIIFCEMKTYYITRQTVSGLPRRKLIIYKIYPILCGSLSYGLFNCILHNNMRWKCSSFSGGFRISPKRVTILFWQISEALHEIFNFRFHREWAMEFPPYLNTSTSKVIGYVNAELHHMQPSSDNFIPRTTSQY